MAIYQTKWHKSRSRHQDDNFSVVKLKSLYTPVSKLTHPAEITFFSWEKPSTKRLNAT